MRYRLAVLAASLAAVALSAPVLAQSAAQTAALEAASNELAAAVVPERTADAQVDRLVEAMLVQMFLQNESLKQLETVYPGMKDALGAGVKPVMIRASLKVMPSFRAELAALYRANLTAGEARTAANFLRSPVFVAFAASAQSNVDFKSTAKALAAERDVTAAELRSDIQSAGVKSGIAMPPANRTAFMAFFTSPLGIKLTSLNPQKLAIEAKWANYTDREIEMEVETAVKHAMVSHIALTDPETAELVRQDFAKPAK